MGPVTEQPILVGLDFSSGVPMWRRRPSPDAAAERAPLIGGRLAYRVDPSARRWCLGHLRRDQHGAERVDCAVVVAPPERRCTSCRVAEARAADQLHQAHLRTERDPLMAEFMNWPNLVYLAAFADGSVKVGTSRRERIETRLLEQGAWLAVIVAEVTDGYQVRRLEDLLSHEFDLSQSVSVRRKQTGLVNPRPSDLLSADLDRWVERVTPFVDDFGATTIARRWEHPDRRELEQRRLLAYPADPTVGPHDLGLAGTVGRIGLAQRADAADWFIFDLGVLFGLELDWGDHGSTPLVIQDSLF